MFENTRFGLGCIKRSWYSLYLNRNLSLWLRLDYTIANLLEV